MKIRFDGKSTEEFFQWMADKVTEISLPIMKEALQSDAEGEILLVVKKYAIKF